MLVDEKNTLGYFEKVFKDFPPGPSIQNFILKLKKIVRIVSDQSIGISATSFCSGMFPQ
jgi:hypothetical protein